MSIKFIDVIRKRTSFRRRKVRNDGDELSLVVMFLFFYFNETIESTAESLRILLNSTVAIDQVWEGKTDVNEREKIDSRRKSSRAHSSPVLSKSILACTPASLSERRNTVSKDINSRHALAIVTGSKQRRCFFSTGFASLLFYERDSHLHGRPFFRSAVLVGSRMKESFFNELLFILD